jgi:hypothetical protein
MHQRRESGMQRYFDRQNRHSFDCPNKPDKDVALYWTFDENQSTAASAGIMIHENAAS